MKKELTAQDSPGYYICRYNPVPNNLCAQVRKWDGVRLYLDENIPALDSYTNFERVYTEDEFHRLFAAKTEALAQELLALQKTCEEMRLQFGVPGPNVKRWRWCDRSGGGEHWRYWENSHLIGGSNRHCEKTWPGFEQLYTKQDVDDIERSLRASLESKDRDIAHLKFWENKHRQELSDLRNEKQKIDSYACMLDAEVKHLRADLESTRASLVTSNDRAEKLAGKVKWLESELDARKSNPYSMLEHALPNCIGLWEDSTGVVFKVDRQSQLASYTSYGPYRYIGPLPPKKPQQEPPKIVNVRWKSTGAIYRAIPCNAQGKVAAYMLLNNDGSGSAEFAKIEFVEEVQS